jgi:hypothetical protein
MKTIIFNTMNAVFRFDQKDVMEFLICKGSDYDLDEVAKLLERISADSNETIVIPEEPNYFDSIALDLIAAGKGFMLVVCITCNKAYVAGQLNPIIVGFDGSPLDIQRERKGVLKRLFAKKRKPPSIYAGRGYDCPAGHNLISVMTWKLF